MSRSVVTAVLVVVLTVGVAGCGDPEPQRYCRSWDTGQQVPDEQCEQGDEDAVWWEEGQEGEDFEGWKRKHPKPSVHAPTVPVVPAKPVAPPKPVVKSTRKRRT